MTSLYRKSPEKLISYRPFSTSSSMTHSQVGRPRARDGVRRWVR
jgi:hypothetical protein